MRVIRVGGSAVEMHDDGLTVTVLPDGSTVTARAEETDSYERRAHDLGYGSDTARMSRDHEIGHSLLADLLGLSCSPTLRGVSRGESWSYWREEEGAVLALQRYANAVGVDLVEIARERSASMVRQFA